MVLLKSPEASRAVNAAYRHRRSAGSRACRPNYSFKQRGYFRCRATICFYEPPAMINLPPDCERGHRRTATADLSRSFLRQAAAKRSGTGQRGSVDLTSRRTAAAELGVNEKALRRVAVGCYARLGSAVVVAFASPRVVIAITLGAIPAKVVGS